MSDILPASALFRYIKHFHKYVDDNYDQPSTVLSKLRSDQRRSIKWMIDRENHNDCKLIIT